MGETADQTERHRGTVFERQRLERPLDRETVLHGGRSGAVQRPFLLVAGVARSSLSPRPLGALGLAPGNAAQPAAHARLTAKRPRVSPRGEKGFLRHVVGVSVVAENLPQKRADGLLVSI